MAELSLKALIRVKKYRSWKGEVGKTAPDILKRDFNAQKPDEKWVTDVKAFAVGGEKLYRSPVIDLFNGEVVSCSMSERPVMNMVGAMLEKALQEAGVRGRTGLTLGSGLAVSDGKLSAKTESTWSYAEHVS